MNLGVDHYLKDGCGRCPLGATPDCKVNNWKEEMIYLRKIILSCGLTEQVKWGVPCYTIPVTESNKTESNILIMSALKDYCTISFFKGALLTNVDSMLEKPGENTQAARLIKFTGIEQILVNEEQIRTWIFEAVAVEKSELKVEMNKTAMETIPGELKLKFMEEPDFKLAFNALTPGRQRGYILYFSQPKQSKTRVSRIEKYSPKILDGKGMQDK
ncbi:YdeI/OmpD-associated family protein [Cyclobacterium qasimii]|uniref:DUF1801 domain-containing protein n=2 Tax=Cyclobacterium qasimii TaxID=1350429 RepID=S7VE02_9BACT|nr:DUF1801 domain-containing protein [Cyclobacterium qasimii]EPR67757.1 DUF1801 domain-containing protein [Cyclobacterium qasimii M12-11B]GEO20354.1 hypothetical protein CQA01_08880 [Cyclobacterium qasimii]